MLDLSRASPYTYIPAILSCSVSISDSGNITWSFISIVLLDEYENIIYNNFPNSDEIILKGVQCGFSMVHFY